MTNKDDWRHVISSDNPADIISRGINPSELINSILWWRGPKWLSYYENQWPTSTLIKISDPSEQKHHTKVMVSTFIDMSLFEKYSSFLKLQRVVTYLLRFKANCLKQNVCKGSLQVHDVQSHCFFEEIMLLNKNKEIQKGSNLKNLNPFIDKEKLLREGGRLNHSDFEYDQKYPIILPKNHLLAKLLITYEHRKLLHAGLQALLANIRTRFWPIGGRNEVKRVLKNCIVCFRVKPITMDTLLGQLPKQRITPCRPFLNVAVDYAGPFHIKVGLARSKQLVKAYLCVFICLVTKALHLELVTDLTTKSFLNAFKRFVSRRGKSLHIYSDNGTTFVSANRELSNFLSQVQCQNSFYNFFTNEVINWHFIPPRSPPFGGIWESAIKAVKYHMRRTIGNASLTYEEFYTIIVQIEACLNSRPLTPLSSDINDLNPLTQGHFLIGASLLAVPEPDIKELKTGRLDRYQQLTQLMQQFWSRWSKDYITELQHRSSHGIPSPQNLASGTMVLLVENNLPPMSWCLGRILETRPGEDGIIRVVTVRNRYSPMLVEQLLAVSSLFRQSAQLFRVRLKKEYFHIILD